MRGGKSPSKGTPSETSPAAKGKATKQYGFDAKKYTGPNYMQDNTSGANGPGGKTKKGGAIKLI
jgi:hypothetical protein